MSTLRPATRLRLCSCSPGAAGGGSIRSPDVSGQPRRSLNRRAWLVRPRVLQQGGRSMRTLAVALLPVSLIAIIFAPGPAGAQAPAPAPPPQVAYGPPITLEQAKKVMAAAEAEARKNNWNVVISVIDSGGHLVSMERLDGTQLGSIE